MSRCGVDCKGFLSYAGQGSLLMIILAPVMSENEPVQYYD
jgi:hypothetical protein